MPRTSNERELETLCSVGGKVGYVLERATWITNTTIREASDIVSKVIEDHMRLIRDGWERNIKKFYIGKTSLKCVEGIHFSPRNSKTWNSERISQRCSYHFKKKYGKNGLIVLAVVTEESIPESYNTTDDVILHHEEYALTLEKRLIHKFQKKYPNKNANKTKRQGNTDNESSIAYVVYMTFTVDDWPCWLLNILSDDDKELSGEDAAGEGTPSSDAEEETPLSDAEEETPWSDHAEESSLSDNVPGQFADYDYPFSYSDDEEKPQSNSPDNHYNCDDLSSDDEVDELVSEVICTIDN